MNNNILNLVPAIKALEGQIKELRSEYLEKVIPYEDSLRQLRKINMACEKCEGAGKVLRYRACAEDDRPDPNDPRDYVTCNACGGTGLVLHDSADDEVRVCRNCKYRMEVSGPDHVRLDHMLLCVGQKGTPAVKPTDTCERWETD